MTQTHIGVDISSTTLDIHDPRTRFEEIHRRMEEAKASPLTQMTPSLAALLSGAPRALFRAASVPLSANIDLIVTNVPGLPVERYVAGARIDAIADSSMR